MARDGNKAVKICGITREEDLLACLELRFAWVGFNFCKLSKRFLDPHAAARIWRSGCRSITDQNNEEIFTCAAAVVCDCHEDELRGILAAFPELAAIQLHGHENESQVSAARSIIGERQLWRAVHINVDASQGLVEQLSDHSSVDMIVLDAKPSVTSPKKGELGGTGESFQWSQLRSIPSGVSFALAGGVNPDNIKVALGTEAVLIDICSGVEDSPGRKSMAKLKIIAEAAQGDWSISDD